MAPVPVPLRTERRLQVRRVQATPSATLEVDHDRPGSFRKRVLLTATLALAAFAAVFLAWEVLFWLAVAFAAVLVGSVLRGAACRVGEWTRIGPRWGLGVVVLVLLLVGLGGGWLTYSRLSTELTRLAERLPEAWEQAKPQLRELPGGGMLVQELSDTAGDGAGFEAADMDLRAIAGRALRYGRSMLAALAGAALVFVTGLYLAADPHTYVNGFKVLLPEHRQAEVADALHDAGHTLRWWFVGQATAMAVLGLLTGTGLWLLGVPLFFTLGVLTALLCFIPNFGPILSVIPPLILALGTEDGGGALALKVVALYVGIQLVESYVITPLIQKKAVSLPPALLIIGQVILAALLGIVGLALAAPIIATTITLVRRLYLKVESQVAD